MARNNPVKFKIKKGDTVYIRAGKYKGKSGTVTEVHPKKNRVSVEGINESVKHRKPSQSNPQGGVEKITLPIHVSNVGYKHPSKKDSATRVGFTQKDSKNAKKRVLIQASKKEIK